MRPGDQESSSEHSVERRPRAPHEAVSRLHALSEAAKDGWRSRQKSSEPYRAPTGENAIHKGATARRRASDAGGLLLNAAAAAAAANVPHRRHPSGLFDRFLQHVKRATVSPADSKHNSRSDVREVRDERTDVKSDAKEPGKDVGKAHKWSRKGKQAAKDGHSSVNASIKVSSWVRTVSDDERSPSFKSIETRTTIELESTTTLEGALSEQDLRRSQEKLAASPTLALPMLEALGLRQAPGSPPIPAVKENDKYDMAPAQSTEEAKRSKVLERQLSTLSSAGVAESFSSSASIGTAGSQIMDPIRSLDFFIPIAVQPQSSFLDIDSDRSSKRSKKRTSFHKNVSVGSTDRLSQGHSRASSHHSTGSISASQQTHVGGVGGSDSSITSGGDGAYHHRKMGIPSSHSIKSLSRSIASFGSGILHHHSRSNPSTTMRNAESVASFSSGYSVDSVNSYGNLAGNDDHHRRSHRHSMPQSLSRIGLAFRNMGGHDRHDAKTFSLSRHSSRSSPRIRNMDSNWTPRSPMGTAPRNVQWGFPFSESPQPTESPPQTDRPHRSLPSELEKSKDTAKDTTPTSSRKTGLANSRSRSVDFNTDKKGRSNSKQIAADRRRYHSHQVVETSTIYAMHEAPHSMMSPLGEVEETQGKVNQYHIIKDIGSGAYGRVVLCRNEQDRRYYACKIVSKARLRKKFRWSGGPGNRGPPSAEASMDHLSSIKREVAILKKLSKHPNINALVEVLDDGKEDNLYMIFELCEYGPIMKIQMRDSVNPLSEDLARRYFRDVVLGLEYLHYKRIIHRDIKPENLLLKAGPPLGVVQIADFGISNMFEDGEEEPVVDDKNSSPLFSPPEACQSHTRQLRGFAVDIWALGVSLYCLVHGRAPWQEESIILLYEKIVETPAETCVALSTELQDLLAQMLKKDPDERITLQNVKEHPWITNKGTDPMMATEENCVFEEVTEEEVENAFQPAMMFVTKIMNRLKGKSKSKDARTFSAPPTPDHPHSASVPVPFQIPESTTTETGEGEEAPSDDCSRPSPLDVLDPISEVGGVMSSRLLKSLEGRPLRKSMRISASADALQRNTPAFGKEETDDAMEVGASIRARNAARSRSFAGQGVLSKPVPGMYGSRQGLGADQGPLSPSSLMPSSAEPLAWPTSPTSPSGSTSHVMPFPAPVSVTFRTTDPKRLVRKGSSMNIIAEEQIP
ncbi:hypothetical protein HKX48_009303 [Thoreauomyces humboldtii]|nr:hypothetical protein HKX48_009303 [Thoreauomyces humboldtii]